MTSSYRHLFGPVPSRRFGRSLGVDLVPLKTCSFDCVFCQLGPTTDKTRQRREYVSLDEIRAEMRDWLQGEGMADYITLAGSGEPTLHSRFGEVVDAIREQTEAPVLLLTNGSLLSDAEVRRAAAETSVVKTSLSVWDEASLQQLNRPQEGIHFDGLVEGLTAFRQEFNGELFIEVFVVADINDSPEEMGRIAAILEPIQADRIQLNTAVRPPAESFVRPCSQQHLLELTDLFEPRAEVIAEYQAVSGDPFSVSEQRVLELLERRPCSLEDIAQAFNLHRHEVSKYVGRLIRKRRIESERRGDAFYYMAEKQAED